MITYFIWNVASSTHGLFRCNRSRNIEENTGGFLHFVPLKLAPAERKDRNFFDTIKFEPVWAQCRYNFSENCYLNVTNNPLTTNQNSFID